MHILVHSGKIKSGLCYPQITKNAHAVYILDYGICFYQLKVFFFFALHKHAKKCTSCILTQKKKKKKRKESKKRCHLRSQCLETQYSLTPSSGQVIHDTSTDLMVRCCIIFRMVSIVASVTCIIFHMVRQNMVSLSNVIQCTAFFQ